MPDTVGPMECDVFVTCQRLREELSSASIKDYPHRESAGAVKILESAG